jgi:hypothetical protein
MTKYRLKDQELQKKLDEITDGDFSECLEKGAVDQFCRVGSIGVTCGRFGCNGHPRLKIDFYLHEYEELKEYNPNDWNNFPDTTPPENIPMRVEFIWNDGALGKCCGVYRNGVWSNSEDRDCEIENVKRFRPWE